MKTIEPKYITFEQAKWLKEKGFDVPILNWYHKGTKKLNRNDLLCSMNKLTDNYSAPEQWQVVEYLRVNHNIDLQAVCNYGRLGRTYKMGIIFINKEKEVDTIFLRPIDMPYSFIEFNSPQEAYSAAFDYIKENNLI